MGAPAKTPALPGGRTPHPGLLRQPPSPLREGYSLIRDRVREVVRSFPSSASIGEVIRKLNPILNGWCTYFRVGNSNRTFHQIDWAVLSEL